MLGYCLILLLVQPHATTRALEMTTPVKSASVSFSTPPVAAEERIITNHLLHNSETVMTTSASHLITNQARGQKIWLSSVDNGDSSAAGRTLTFRRRWLLPLGVTIGATALAFLIYSWRGR